MKDFTLKAAIALEEASRIANRWAYSKSIKTLLQDWLIEGLQKKQDGARAVYEQFLSELNENLACLPSKSVRVYLSEVKRVLCYKRRFHQGILASHYPKEGLMAKCQQMNNGTTYQSLAWQQVYDILALENDITYGPSEYCIDGEDCRGCDSCKAYPNSVNLDLYAREDFRIYYTIAVGATDYWLAGTKEVEYRLAALPPTPRKRKTSFKSRASKLGPWQGILNRKFSLHDLNRVLAHVGILKDEAGSVLSKSARKGSWPGVFEALTEMLRIPEIKNRTKLFEAIIFQYGKDATSLSTMRAYNAKNKASLYAYTSVKNLIVDEALKLNLKYHLK